MLMLVMLILAGGHDGGLARLSGESEGGRGRRRRRRTVHRGPEDVAVLPRAKHHRRRTTTAARLRACGFFGRRLRFWDFCFAEVSESARRSTTKARGKLTRKKEKKWKS